ncbi:MAG TPA: ABC transporter substrate-binding protein [Tepidisphaeraceae bacterium]|jgi:NitT/TauT family transport system substrate-binding protein|nr:ABC transporter substrate-binding protein [Tepidisphaeraceae bacterium]
MIRNLICLAMIVITFGCDTKSSTSTGGGASGSRVKLQLNWKAEPEFGGFYAAKENGNFKKHGVDVDVVEGGAGTPTVQMVAAGKVEFGIVSADELIVARSNGADVVALFAAYQTCPQGIMVHAERGFKEIADVFKSDGTVAMQKGLPYYNFLEKKFGFGKVKIVPSPNGDLSVFRTDPKFSMQCFVTSEPIAARHAGLKAQTFLVSDAGYNPYTTVLVTRGDYLKANQQIVKSVVDAVREGWEAYLKDPIATNSSMQKLNPTMDAQTFADSAEAQKVLIETDDTKKLGIGAMTPQRWQTLIDQLADLKVIEKKPTATECFTELK